MPPSATRARQVLKVSSAPSARATRPIWCSSTSTTWLIFPNSTARQLVYTEAGRAVESVIVDGRVVMKERKIKTIDEDALRREVNGLMRHFIADYEHVVASRKKALAHMLEVHRRVWETPVPVNRFVPRTQ